MKKRNDHRALFADVFGNYEGAWLHSGQSLKAAAEILAKEREKQFGTRDWFVEFADHLKRSAKGPKGLVDQYFFMPKTLMPEYMLYGYAIENFLNALCISRKMILYKEGKMVCGGDHNLVDLAIRAGLKLSSDESSTLGGLGTILMVNGRYPLEKNATRPKPPIKWRSLSIQNVSRIMMRISQAEATKQEPTGGDLMGSRVEVVLPKG